jgi:3-oxoadipate enol-lactonase
MKTININDKNFSDIYYRKVGTGPAVMLLHGFPANGDLWSNIYPGLSNSFTLIIPDIPGAGNSILDNENLSLQDLSRFIQPILDNEAVEELVIVGHSMGGYISLAFAETNRPWLKGISLVHSTARADSPEKIENRKKAIEIVRKGAKQAFLKGMVTNMFSSFTQTHNPGGIADQSEKALALKDGSIVAFYNAMMNRKDNTAVLAGMGLPVQWIFGKDDTVIPLESVLHQSRLADTTFVSVYENCGHMSMIEQPERLATDLTEFINYCFNH